MVDKKNVSRRKKSKINIRYPFPVKRPLGRILTESKFIKQENLDAALEEQQNTGKLLGETLVGFGVLGQVERDAAVMIQREFSTIAGAVNAAAGSRMTLEELLLLSSFVTQEQLDEAQQEQRKTGCKLEDALVRFGLFTERQIEIMLAFKARQGTGEPSCLALGELLVSAGYITHDCLKDALERQKETKKKLGEILVETGHCQTHHVEHGLHIQRHLVAAALMAALSLVPIEEARSSGSSSSAMSTTIKVSATVLARSSLHILRQPSEIIVTNADIKKGFLDVSAGSLLEVRNNSRAGVSLIFDVHGLPFREIIVSGLDSEVSLGPNGGMITRQMTGANILSLSYRFVFDEYSQAGTYAWPLSLAVNPVE
jgi:hypothetical protein